jgi:hypothetical protein
MHRRRRRRSNWHSRRIGSARNPTREGREGKGRGARSPRRRRRRRRRRVMSGGRKGRIERNATFQCDGWARPRHTRSRSFSSSSLGADTVGGGPRLNLVPFAVGPPPFCLPRMQMQCGSNKLVPGGVCPRPNPSNGADRWGLLI